MTDRADLRDLERAQAVMSTSIARLEEQVKQLQGDVRELVTKAEFAPVRMIAYGLATAVLSSVIMAVLAKVIIQ